VREQYTVLWLFFWTMANKGDIRKWLVKVAPPNGGAAAAGPPTKTVDAILLKMGSLA
jgi:hypothetical protein